MSDVTRRMEVRVRDDVGGWVWVRYAHPRLYVEAEASGALRVAAYEPGPGVVLTCLYAPGEWREIRPWSADDPSEGVPA